jgi:PIN domain nuclease of toxin-antitoxin system
LTFPESPDIYIPKQRKQHLINSLAIDENTISYLMNLPSLHKDPFDRLLICHALQYNLMIVTEDNAILSYPNLLFLK